MLTIGRGQPIEILTSSAEGRRHPVAGDKGFISNAYLCPRIRLIVCDIYFFRFGNEMCSRCERRLFIINLGMPADIESKIKSGMTRTEFEILTDDHINLTPAIINRVDAGAVRYPPYMFSNIGIFRGQIRRPASNTMKAMVKIPVGLVKSLSGYHNISDYNTALALFKSVRPVLHHLMLDLNSIDLVRSQINVTNAINKLINSKFFYASVPDFFGDRTYIYNPIDNMPFEELIENTRKIQSIARVVFRKTLNKSLVHIMNRYRQLVQAGEGEFIPKRFINHGVMGWFHDENRKMISDVLFTEKFLSYVLYILAFSETSVECMKEVYSIIQNTDPVHPPMWLTFSSDKSIRKIMEIRQAGGLTSAALPRLLGAEPFF